MRGIASSIGLNSRGQKTDIRGPQILSTYQSLHNASRAGNASSRTDRQLQIRQQHDTGQFSVSKIQMAFSAYIMVNTDPGYTDLATHTVQGALEQVSPAQTSRFLFSGLNSYDMAAGEKLKLSDVLDITLTGIFFDRKEFTLPAANYLFPDALTYNPAGTTGYVSPITTSQLMNTGAMTLPTGGLLTTNTPTTALIGVIAQKPFRRSLSATVSEAAIWTGIAACICAGRRMSMVIRCRCIASQSRV